MRLIVLCVSLFLGTSVLAGEAKVVRLLTIGNSFSANATRYLGDLAKAGGHTLIHQPLVIGGASFQVHAEKAQKHEASPDDTAGLYANGKGLKENLAAESWDYVTIQQASIKSHDFATYQPHAGWLRDFVAQHAPQARLLIHETWAYRKDDPRFTKPSDKLGEPRTQAEMYLGLRAAYGALAQDFGARIIPTGDAFYLADVDPIWGFRTDASFNSQTAKPPALPDQTHSLHVGWYWKKQPNGNATLSMDGHHANTAGEYLGACVWYEVLFGDVEGNPFTPKSIDADYARFLQKTARQAVAN